MIKARFRRLLGNVTFTAALITLVVTGSVLSVVFGSADGSSLHRYCMDHVKVFRDVLGIKLLHVVGYVSCLF